MSSENEARDREQSRAIVLGAGIAGLVATRVLADHFEKVTIVDQEQLPTEAAPRNGVPQSRHVHLLLNSGRTIMNRFFPGFDDELGRAGAPLVDGIKDLAWLTSAGWSLRYPSRYRAYSASRPLIEHTIRQRLRVNPRVSWVEGQSALGLVASADGNRVSGVRVRTRHGEATEETLGADLVVDATGRGSRATQWLRDLGYPEPERTEIDAHVGYSTRLYRQPTDLDLGWRGVYIQGKLPTILRGGVLLSLESETWIVTLAGFGRDYPPTDDEGFREFARSLRSPLIYDAIKDAEPLTPGVATRSTANVWRHYERLARWPEGFIAIGDAVCAFNPVYGQGMSVAAKEAVALDTALRERSRNGGAGFARTFQKRIVREIAPVWTIATAEDVKTPGVEGGQPGRIDRFMGKYLERVIQLTTEDVFAQDIFRSVLNLDKPATAFFHPRLVAKVILGPTGRGAQEPRPTRVTA